MPDGRPSERMGRGLLGSLLLHVLAALLLLLTLPGPPPEPPPEPVISVDLVQLGAATVSPQPRRSTQPPHETAPPAPRPAPTTAAPHAAPAATPLRPEASRKRRPKAGPHPKPAAPEDFDARLRAEAEALQTAPAVGSQQSRGGHAMGDANAAVNSGAYGPHAAYSAKDFIRAQIERRWNFDVAALGKARWVISIHVVLQSDGTVASAAVLEDPRYRRDPAYHALANSVRNAVLVSSPLHLPPGTPAALLDMVLDFDPRADLR